MTFSSSCSSVLHFDTADINSFFELISDEIARRLRVSCSLIESPHTYTIMQGTTSESLVQTRVPALEQFVRQLLDAIVDEAQMAHVYAYSDAPHHGAEDEKPTEKPASFYGLLQDADVPVVDVEEHSETNSVIVQIRSHVQHEHRSCGYRALHNCLSSALAIHHLHHGSHHRSRQFVKRLHCSAHFWVSQRRFKAMLHKRVHELTASAGADELSYFWTAKTVDDDVMERIYLEHLLTSDQLLVNLGGTDTFSSFSEFGYSTLRFNRLSMFYIKKLDRILEEFRKHDRHRHAFILGQTNHWVSVIGYKSGSKIEVFYIDSTNRHPVLRGDESDFQRIADEIQIRRRFFNPRLITQPAQERWYRTQDLDCLRGCNYTVHLLHDCLVGRTTPLAALLRLNMEGFLETWHKCMDSALQKANQSTANEEEVIPSFRASFANDWIANYFPAPVFEKNLKAVLEEVGSALPLDLARRLQNEFLEPVKVFTRGFTEPEVHARMFEVFRWLENFLDSLVQTQTQ